MSSGMWHHVVWHTSNKVLGTPVLLPALGSNNSLTAKIVAGALSEISVLIYKTSRHYILEDTDAHKVLNTSKNVTNIINVICRWCTFVYKNIHQITQYPVYMTWEGSVSTVSRLWDGWSGVQFPAWMKNFSPPPKHPDLLWAPTTPLK